MDKSYKHKNIKYRESGLTLIELCIAMAMTTIIIGIIFATWANFHKHITIQQRKSILYTEARQIADMLQSQIRRSPAVISWHQTGITFISSFDSTAGNKDTVIYEYYSEELRKNDKPVLLISQNARIIDFKIEEDNENQIVENKYAKLLSILIIISDNFNNQVEIPFKVAVKIAKQEDEEEEWEF